ncbi:zinc finger, C3HC4 type, domain containing protein [Musa troglodytarum]|uniref:E3 ubiquitin-protein ligase RMA n=1 Tax=Musa troglodytarum TaxID=320322 RepID=A0A9E7HTM8_9LILI|nr:zinc finger, C3HC4 type, domain containing protein [Musa troglodytarum]
MDLNLYLGLPRSPRPLSFDLGSDLALSSLPLSSSFTSVEAREVPILMSGVVNPHPSYSPSDAEYTPDLPAVPPSERVDSPEYTPYFPSYERYGPSILPIPPVVEDLEGPDAPDSPIFLPLPAVQEHGETAVQDLMLYDPASPPRLADQTVVYSPPYVTGSMNPQDHEAASLSFYPSDNTQTGEFLCPGSGPSARPETVRYRESHFRRLIEPSNQWRNRRFRSLLPHAGERFSSGSPSLPNPEQLVHDVLNSHRLPECHGKHIVTAGDNAGETSEEGRDEKGSSAANFECNICFDMAAEPVVTPCGHLFCWPCLYQWLHVHSDHKECPVCKGEVTDSNITPIYGRGSLQPHAKKKNEEDGESTLKIPPRPSGNRFESFRQQLRPVPRRLDEGIATSWRRFLEPHMRSGYRYETFAELSFQEIFDNVRRSALNSLRQRRLPREVNSESVSITGEARLPENNMPSPMRNYVNYIFGDGVDLWHDIGSDRLAAAVMTTSIGSAGEHLASSSHGFDASTSSLDPPNHEPPVSGICVEVAFAADQAPTSSTIAVIQGDVAADAVAEPNSVGSSRSARRRGRSSISGSFDVDGGTIGSRKRRLN